MYNIVFYLNFVMSWCFVAVLFYEKVLSCTPAATGEEKIEYFGFMTPA